ncbi:hypothetical protein CHH83_02740 [Bacillus sp. 7586-K]|nr:hypothetical protein CHH83_02740 [Bacillus sp. 7586-K]
MYDELSIYVMVDEQGNVIRGMGGTNPRPEKEYHYFFVRDLITLENISKFKVVLNGFIPDLVLKDGEVLEEIKHAPEPI